MRRLADARTTPDRGVSRASISVVGNAESVHVVSRATALGTLGYDVTLITPRAVDHATCRQVSLEELGGKSPAVGGLRRMMSKLSAARAIFAANAGDATHIHYAQGVWAGLGLVLGTRPLIVTVMGGDVLFGEQADSSWADRALTRLILRNADLVTAKSAHLASVVRALGVPDPRVMILYWGVDTGVFRPVDAADFRRTLGLAADDLVLLSPRFLRPLYNVAKIIEALPLIRAGSRSTKLLVLDYGSDPDYRTDLLRRAAQLGVAQNVMLVPPRPREQMPLLYAASDVVISVPASDGMPMTVLEALACGKPTIITDLPHYRELFVHGENVLACPPNPEAIAEAVSMIATQPELAARLAASAATTIAERADLKKDLARLDDRLVRLIDGRRRRQPFWVRVLAAALLALSYGNQAFRSMAKSRPRTSGGLAT